MCVRCNIRCVVRCRNIKEPMEIIIRGISALVDGRQNICRFQMNAVMPERTSSLDD
jgi:hypothetical protein